MSIGNRIKQRRESILIDGKPMTKACLARKVGISHQRVDYIEKTNVDDMKLGMLRRYADALGTTVEALADGAS